MGSAGPECMEGSVEPPSSTRWRPDHLSRWETRTVRCREEKQRAKDDYDVLQDCVISQIIAINPQKGSWTIGSNNEYEKCRHKTPNLKLGTGGVILSGCQLSTRVAPANCIRCWGETGDSTTTWDSGTSTGWMYGEYSSGLSTSCYRMELDFFSRTKLIMTPIGQKYVIWRDGSHVPQFFTPFVIDHEPTQWERAFRVSMKWCHKLKIQKLAQALTRGCMHFAIVGMYSLEWKLGNGHEEMAVFEV